MGAARPLGRWQCAGEKTFILEAGCVAGRWLCCRRGQLFILEAGCVAGRWPMPAMDV